MNVLHRRRLGRCLISFTLILTLAGIFKISSNRFDRWLAAHSPFSKKNISQAIGPSLRQNRFPSSINLAQKEQLRLRYTIDPQLQGKIKQLIRAYNPDWASFVALDARTGKVLSMFSHSSEKSTAENLALKASFPAASVFKIVTAAAAVESHDVSAETIIPFNGRSHTLYKNNVKYTRTNRWTRYMPLRKAFGKSINTVFGKLGMNILGYDLLIEYAQKLGFNRPIPADFPIQASRVDLDPKDPWALAEVASGFTRDNTLSPLHGALLAAVLANDGVMMEPYIVDRISTPEGALLYEAQPQAASVSLAKGTTDELRNMMQETVKSGTSRGSFRSFLRSSRFRHLEVGGKTGSLTGKDPKGKCDWFVGYASDGNERIAFAALTINKEYWKVRSAYLARKYIEAYFRQQSAQKRLQGHASNL